MGTEPMWMSLLEFRERYPDESQNVEFKQGLSAKKVQEAVVAFSNAEGGVILIGVDDDGRPTGHEPSEDGIREIHELCGNAHSVGRYDVARLLVGDVTVTVLRVEPGQGEISQTSDGRPLVRRGKMNVPLLGSELAARAAERSRDRYEDGPSGVPLSSAHPGLVGQLWSEVGWSDHQDGLLQSPYTASGELTVAGALLLCDETPRRLGKAFVEVLRYSGDSNRYDRREQFDGPVSRQVERATQFVADELGVDMAFVGVRRVEIPRIPRPVLREAITNAVGHRDYMQNGTSVVVELRPDRVIVRSPGGFVAPVTVDNIREQQASRNPQLMRALRALRVAEDAGRGVDTMIDEMEAALLDPPQFEDAGNSVVVTLPLGGTVTADERATILELENLGSLRPAERRLLVPLLRGSSIDNGTVRQLLGVESHQATRALQRLAEAGLVRRRGRTSGATYEPSEDLLDRLRTGAVNEQERQVVELARRHGERGVQNADVRDLLGIGPVEARRVLAAMAQRGVLRREGQRRTSRYVAP
jgi:ATP-dependent DNA helicase RecG